jgi:Subtilisin inhibitor-like
MAVLIAVLLAAVACGASQGTAGSTPTTELTITFWPEGRDAEESKRWTLRCSPAAGTMPRAAATCARLLALTKPFAPQRKNLVCTDIFGGPQQAVIAGRYKGERIWTALGLRNGCQIARAKKLAFLVPGFSANPNS